MTTTRLTTISLLALTLPTPALARHKESSETTATVSRARLVSKPDGLDCEAVRLAESNLRIVVWVYNYARVSERDLAWAEKVAGTVLHQAGVALEWLDCPVSKTEINSRPVCQERMHPAELALVILPSLAEVHPDSGSLLGYSQIFVNRNSGHYAYVSYELVEGTARRGPAAAYEALGYVAAHELGHLLLDSDAHSPSGIMRCRLEEEDFRDGAVGVLWFTPQQAQRIRANAAVRMKQGDLPTAFRIRLNE